MSRKTTTWNAYETKLAGPLLAGFTSVSVESTAGLEDAGLPAYLVLDPDIPTLREWIRVGTISPELFSNIARNQEGSVGNIDHDTGAIVRAVFTKQLQDDMFTDVEDLEGAALTHINNAGDPHAAAGYLKQADLTAHANDAGDPHAAAGYLKSVDPNFPVFQTEQLNPGEIIPGTINETFIELEATVPDEWNSFWWEIGGTIEIIGKNSGINPGHIGATMRDSADGTIITATGYFFEIADQNKLLFPLFGTTHMPTLPDFQPMLVSKLLGDRIIKADAFIRATGSQGDIAYSGIAMSLKLFRAT